MKLRKFKRLVLGALVVVTNTFSAYCGGDADDMEMLVGSMPDPFPMEEPGAGTRVDGPLLKMASTIPARWDAREHGWVTGVKRQGKYQTCWAFAACSVLETALLKGGVGEFDFSEKNMVRHTGWDATANTGGNITMSGNYLLSWQGPALETDDPYPAQGTTDDDFGESRMLLPRFKVLGAVRVPKRESAEDTATMKEAIMRYGSLVVPYHTCTNATCYIRATGAFYCDEYTNTSHLVAVVGWDDAYSKDNFATTPPGDGAWLVKNSWGTNVCDKGYLHISYYDTTFGMVAEMGAFIVAGAGQDYDAVYNYARAGYCRARGWNNTTDTIAGAAIYTAASDEALAAVGFYALSDKTEYAIQVYTGCTTEPDTGTCVYSGPQGVSSYRGYVTVPLTNEVALKRGTRFSVIVKLRCPTYGYPLAYAVSRDWSWITVTAEAASGQTFIRNVSDDGPWSDFTKAGPTASFCCSAYVRETKTPASEGCVGNGATWDAEQLNDWYAGIDPSASGRLQFGKTPGAYAGVRGLNGYSLLENYMLGFSPTNEAERLMLSIRMQNGEPIVEWNRTNSEVSVYSLHGSTDLKAWHEEAEGDQFFRLHVTLP